MGNFWHALVTMSSGDTFSARIEKLTMSSLTLSSGESIPTGEAVTVTCFGVVIEAQVETAKTEATPMVVSFEPSVEVRQRITERLRERHGVTPGKIPDLTTDVDEVPAAEALRALTSPSGIPVPPRTATVSQRPPSDEPTTEPGGSRPLDFEDEHTEDLTPEQTEALHAAFEKDANFLALQTLNTHPKADEEEIADFGQDTLPTDEDSEDLRP